jgi:hypothetical protein
VTAEEIAETVKLGFGLVRVHDDPFERFADLMAESADHGVCGFADGDDEHAGIGMQVEQVIADAKDSALAMNVAFEGAINGRFGQGVEE